MITLRKSDERGHFNFGWLNTYHTFSFSDYYDPKHVQFRSLRVINEDRVKPGEGFGTHPHRDMEIVSYVLEGALAHKDSLGNGSTIKPGDVQRMSAGTGVTHSEFNASKDELVHFLQIWLLPTQNGLKPGYEQKFYSADDKRGLLRLIASPTGQDGSVTIHQDANIYATVLSEGQQVQHEFDPNRYGYVQVARGAVTLNGQTLAAGDGAEINAEEAVTLAGVQADSEVLLFDLA